MHILGANQNLYKTWYANALESNGLLISADTARIGTAISGNVEVDGKPIDTTALFNELSEMMRAKFEEAKTLTSSTVTEGLDPKARGAEGQRAIMYMQYALVLMGIAAIIMLCRL